MSKPSPTSLSILTGGMLAPLGTGINNSTSMISQGYASDPFAIVPIVNPGEIGIEAAAELAARTIPSTPINDYAALAGTLIYDSNGKAVNVTADTSIDVGKANLTFDPKSGQGKLNSSLNTVSNSGGVSTTTDLGGDIVTFSGSDIRIMIEVADALGPNHWSKQFFECSTLTVSVFRVKQPARACGFIGARGYSRGGRTIAGTFVLTEMGTDALYELLSAFALRDQSKDSNYVKVDQLPPFNITMLFTNEFGFASSRRLLGVEWVNDGTVYSINDAFTERTISYVAADMTPLLPFTLTQLKAAPAGSNPATDRERSPQDAMQVPLEKVYSTGLVSE